MNKNIFSRTALLIGEDAQERLFSAAVAVFGVGGVGSFVVEALARSGIGHLVLVDFDTVDETNINRQIPATFNTVGEKKVLLMKERVLQINPSADVRAIDQRVTTENVAEFFANEKFSYVVDAIDDIAAKISIIEHCTKQSIPVISAMGAGGKTDPTRFRVADVYKTSVDPLARIMRKRLKERGISKLKTVFSDEEPKRTVRTDNGTTKSPVGSVVFVTGAAGLVLASEVVKDITA